MPAGEEWTTRLRVDVSEFKKGISDASKAIKEANATFKAETAGMDKWSKDADGLQKKLNSLKTVLANQKTILQAYQGQLSKTEEAYEENGRRAEMLKAKLQELAQNGVAKTDAEYQHYESALKEVLKEQDNNGKSCEDLRMKILNQQAAIGKTEGEIRKYTAAQQEMEREAKSIISTVDKQEQELADLKKEYVDVSTAQGKNSDAARDLAKEIERLSKELKENKDKMSAAEKEADQLDESFDDLGDSADETERKFGKLSSKLAGGLKKGLIGIAAGIAALGVGAVVLGKKAIESYAEYEQLIGGVETLFGTGGKSIEEYANSVGKSVQEVSGEFAALEKAQSDVVKNASNAYKTAGLSANEYMSTVTGFSASLISSLGGDTKKAVTYADQAIVDMADNANKMGTDISSIQDTYQGFAKQNYTMLDNLKLGYGGTKTEMERLIADANKVKEANGEMADLSIESFADITEAIHIIQTEMGITGTTAKEASTTISGSVSSMRNAWKNLLTGIADDNQDFDLLLGNFTDSLLTMLGNVMPRIKTVISGLGKLMAGFMAQVLPELVATVPPVLLEMLPMLVEAFRQLIAGVSSVFPELVGVFKDLVPELTQSILGLLPELMTAGVQMVLALLEGAGTVIPQVISNVVQIIPKIANAFMTAIPQLIDAAVNFFMAIVDAIPTIVKELQSALPQIVDTIVKGLTKSIPALINGAVKLFEAIVKAIPQIIPPLIAAIPKLIKALVDGLIRQIPVLLDGAVKLLTALVQAIPTVITRLVKELPKIIVAIVDTLLGNLPKLIKGAIDLFLGILKAIPVIVIELVKAMPQIIAAIVDGLLGGIGAVFAAAGELFFGIVDQSKAASEAIREQNEAIKSYAETLAQTEPVLADYNQLLSDQGNTISELDTKISETEQAITGILSAALREQRELRESDLESIRAYMDEMNRLQEEKLSIYRSQQLAELTKLKLESGEITQATAAQHLANTQKALDEANKATDDAYTARLTAIEQKYQAMNQIGSEAYQTELEAAKTAHDAQIAENKRYSTEALEILSQNSNAWVQQDAEKWAKLNEGMQAFNTSSESGFRNFLINAGDFFNGFNALKDAYLETLSQMDRQSAQGLLNMATQVATSGGQIDEETKKLASNILGSFDNLPAGLDAAGKDALLGMIAGLEAYIPELSSASEMSANEIVDTIKEKLGIASPSTVLAAIGENTTAGLVQGMESKQGEVAKVAQTMATTIEKSFTASSALMTKVGGDIGTNIAKGLQNNIAQIKTAITTIINQAKNLFAANQVNFQRIGTNIVSAIAERMSAGQGRIQSAVRTIIGDINQIFASNQGRFQQIGTSISNAIADNFTRGKPRMQNAASGGANAMAAAMRTSIRSFEDVGAQMARGVWTGFQRQENSLTSNVRSMMRRLVTAVRNEMEVRSPSRVFEKIGAFMAEGLGIGFVREMKATNRAIQQSISPKAIAGGMLSGLQSGMAIGTRIVNNNSTQSFVQNIYAPKQPSRIELYRQTKNWIAMAKGV